MIVDILDGAKCQSGALETHEAYMCGFAAGLICPSRVNKRTIRDTNTLAGSDKHSGQ
jgi:hypothetical protein